MDRSTKSRRKLRFEHLERRDVLAAAVFQSHNFRTDQISVSGSFSYSQVEPEYVDTVANGTFASDSATINWTNANTGRLVISAKVTAPGADQGYAVGQWWPCSDYATEEKGRVEATVDVTAKSLQVDRTRADSVVYTRYRDLTPFGAYCPQGTPWYRFFTGSGTGQFDLQNKKLSRTYERNGTSKVSITVPSTPFNIAEQSATDAAISITSSNEPFEMPDGWTAVTQTSPPPVTPVYDPYQGTLDVQVEVGGRAFAIPSPVTDPVAQVTIFWAGDANLIQTEEISIESGANYLSLFWNSQKLTTEISNLPAPPSWAKYIGTRLVWHNAADSAPANDVRLIPVVQELSHHATTTLANVQGSVTGQFLDAAEAASPDIRVMGYLPESNNFHGTVQVTNDDGRFFYSLPADIDLSSVPQGEQLEDVIDYLVLQNGQVPTYAQHTIVFQGVNDAPIASDDSTAATDNVLAEIDSQQFLWNDYDLDWSDELVVRSVSSTSRLGASLKLRDDGIVEYDPRKSSQLYLLSVGESVVDTFTYEVADPYGAKSSATVSVTVDGADDAPTIQPVPAQFTIQNSSLSFPVAIFDGDNERSSLVISSYSNDSSIVADATVIDGPTGWQVQVTPSPDAIGRGSITITAQDPIGAYTTATVQVIVGTELDADLDGIPNAIEDAAPNQGDMNGDGILDRIQINVASVRAVGSTSFFNLSSPNAAYVMTVEPLAAPSPTGEAAGVQFPVGVIKIELACQVGESVEANLRTPTTAPANTYFEWHANDVGGTWDRKLFDQSTGAVVHSDRISVVVTDGGDGDADGQIDGHILLFAAPGVVRNPWKNTVAEDVNNDGFVSPIDALLIINAINAGKPSNLPAVLTADQVIPDFLDVSDDQVLSAIDALLVINRLNS